MHTPSFCSFRSVCLAFAALGLVLIGAPSRADFVVTANLTGAQETPPNVSSATGSTTFTYETAADTLAYTVSFTGLSSPAIASHIHIGPTGTPGPVILPLILIPATTSGMFTGTLTAVGFSPQPDAGINTFADAIHAIQSGDTYLDIHTGDFPGGEIRGQLTPSSSAVPEPSSLFSLSLGMFGLSVLVLAARRRRSHVI